MSLRDLIDARLTALSNAAAEVYRSIKQRAGPNTAVFVLGYPQLFVPPVVDQADCSEIYGYALSLSERFYLRQVGERLKETLKAAARREGVHFVDVIRWFSGHETCTADPWINSGAERVNDFETPTGCIY
jgi:hypothetical protein